MSLYQPAPSDVPAAPKVDRYLRVGLERQGHGRVMVWLFVPLMLVLIALVVVAISIVVRIRSMEITYAPTAADIARPIKRPLPSDASLLEFGRLLAGRAESWTYHTLPHLADELLPYIAPESRTAQRAFYAKLEENATSYRQAQTGVVLGARVSRRTTTSATIDVAVQRLLVNEDRMGGLSPNRIETVVVSYMVSKDLPTDENAYGVLLERREETDAKLFAKDHNAFWEQSK